MDCHEFAALEKILPVTADLAIFSPVIGVSRVWLSCQAIKLISVLAGLCQVLANPVT